MKEEIEAMTLEEAEAVCQSIDWEASGKFTRKEHDAIASITARYMAGEIDAERCAEILHVTVDQLPAPWIAQ